MRPTLRTALWAIPPAHSLEHIPARSSAIDSRIVRLAQTMGRPAENVEHEIHLVMSRQFAKGRILPLDVAIECHGEAQAFYDAFKLEREWPACPTQ